MLPPEDSASTNFATRAGDKYNQSQACKIFQAGNDQSDFFRLRFSLILIPINKSTDPKIKTKNGNE
jgi:hypothetical protein